MTNFSHKLLAWYHQNKRDFPWRETTDPYKIWLSEIILQQTQAAQGLPYYERFVENYPTIFDLHHADEHDVLKLWQGLGYYSRARNLKKTATFIVEQYQGIFPNTYNNLIKLKGIGPYTAAAIASFAFKEKVPTIDGNVFRVLARIFDVELDIAKTKNRVYFENLALEIIDAKRPDLFNQAMMEFGATHCKPKNPLCDSCIFQDNCLAFGNQTISMRPVKSKLQKPTNRFLNYFVIKDNSGHIIVNQRTEQGIWQGLYELPLIEGEIANWQQDDLKFLSDLTLTSISLEDLVFLGHKKHQLTHQTLLINFYEFGSDMKLKKALSPHEVMKKPFPIVLYHFLGDYFSTA
jgi:A/G-specific adenine glycosylase